MDIKRLENHVELDESGQPLTPSRDDVEALLSFLTLSSSFFLTAGNGLEAKGNLLGLLSFAGYILALPFAFLAGLFQPNSWASPPLWDEGFRSSITSVCIWVMPTRILTMTFSKLTYERQINLCWAFGIIALWTGTRFLYLVGNNHGRCLLAYGIAFFFYSVFTFPPEEKPNASKPTLK